MCPKDIRCGPLPGTLGGDIGDAELLEGATKLRGLAARELFFDRPVIVVANEDAVTIDLETKRYAEAAQQAVEQAEIATRVFGGKKSATRTLRVASSRKPSRVSCGPRSSSQR
jgi:hypothetical protein